MSYTQSKRLFDILFAAAGVILLFPVAVLIGLLIKLSDGGPIHYGQTRIGRFGKPFRIWKFRSMVVQADKLGPPITKEEDERITKLGRLLRKTKLDELPQLWNVLRGDMSFVGPRPEVARYVALYSPEQRRVLQCRPGITDMATVLFRNEAALLRGAEKAEEFYIQYCMPRKIEFNLQYLQSANLFQDLWIIVQTIVPYWVGIVTLYTGLLALSLWAAYALRFDFAVPASEWGQFRYYLPAVLVLQLFLLMWRRQFGGLLSYFSLPELRQTGVALGAACGVQLAWWYYSQGRLAPARSVILLDSILAVVALGWVRMLCRMLRERTASAKTLPLEQLDRVALIGTGELARRLALDLATRPQGAKRVVAFFDDDPSVWHKRLFDIPVVGMPECLLNGKWGTEIEEVIVTLPADSGRRLQQLAEMLKVTPFKVTFATSPVIFRPAEATPLVSPVREGTSPPPSVTQPGPGSSESMSECRLGERAQAARRAVPGTLAETRVGEELGDSPPVGARKHSQAGPFKHGMLALTLKARRVIKLAFRVGPRPVARPVVPKSETKQTLEVQSTNIETQSSKQSRA
jgi:lipopolysaccharide/colanic/teichoic acid biosynthesis glycosyltransferase